LGFSGGTSTKAQRKRPSLLKSLYLNLHISMGNFSGPYGTSCGVAPLLDYTICLIIKKRELEAYRQSRY
jgi:hypothetical protein